MEEQTIVRYIAKQRDDNDARSGIPNQMIDKARSSYQMNVEGYGAELAFCRLANLYPDFSTTVKQGSVDCVTTQGVRIDVKVTRHVNNSYLIVKKTKKNNQDVDLYVLMIGEFPTYTYMGYAKSLDVLQDENLKDWGYADKEAYSIPVSNLV